MFDALPCFVFAFLPVVVSSVMFCFLFCEATFGKKISSRAVDTAKAN
jgi:hypothetical protein